MEKVVTDGLMVRRQWCQPSRCRGRSARNAWFSLVSATRARPV